MKLPALFIAFSAILPISVHSSETTILHATQLAEGEIGPFSVESCCGNTGEIMAPPEIPGVPHDREARALLLHWSEANYRGDRESRGVEIVGPRATNPEMWFGFRFLIPADFPKDQKIILAQLICWEKSAPTNKTLSISINETRLGVNGYFGDKTGLRNPTNSGEATARGELSAELPRERWIDVVLHARLSNQNTGFIRVWFDGAPENEPTFAIDAINLGDAHFDGPDKPRFSAYAKAGMYSWDAANYKTGETRVLWLDALTFIDGPSPEGFSLVAPARKVSAQ